MKSINYAALRPGDVFGVATPASVLDAITGLVTGGKARHVGQLVECEYGLIKCAEMLGTEPETRFYDAAHNRFLLPEDWRNLPTSEAMEACTRMTVKNGLEINGLEKYRPGVWWPWHPRIVWVKRHALYNDGAKAAALSERMKRLNAVGVAYDVGELLSFVGLGTDDPTKWICSRLPIKNLLADGGAVPAQYLKECCPSDYERWPAWQDVDWLKPTP